MMKIFFAAAAFSVAFVGSAFGQSQSLPDAPLPQYVATLSPAEVSSSLQENQPPAAAPATPPEGKEDSASELKKEENQHMLGVIPNFNTVIGGKAAPLTAKQKYHLFFRSALDNPFVYVSTGLIAGYEQANDSYPEYGQGFKGYAKRYGASFADSFDGNLWGNAILTSWWHQDPRYFRMGSEGHTIKERIVYVLYSVVRQKGDNGQWQPAYSNIIGNFIGGAISNVYYPASDRGMALTFERGATVTATGAIGSLAVEFYPDVAAKLFHRKKR